MVFAGLGRQEREREGMREILEWPVKESKVFYFM